TQPCACHPGNVPVEERALPVGEKVRYQPISSFAFGLHGAPFGGGNIGSDFGKCAGVRRIRQSILTKRACAYQLAMQDPICVAAEIEAEMAEILCGIFSLRLRA